MTALVLASPSLSSAHASQVSVTITNNTGDFAADLHIILKGAGTITKATGGFDDETGTKGIGTGNVDLDFGPDTVGNTKSHKFTFQFQNYSGFQSAAWTDTAGDDIPNSIHIGTDISLALGAPLPDGLIPTSVVFDNPSLTATLSLSNYAFATDIAKVDLFTDDPSTLPFGSPISAILSPGSELTTSLGNLVPGTFVVTEGTAQIDSEAPYTYFTAEQVPEPTSIVLLATGCLGLIYGARRRKGVPQTLSASD